MIDSPLLNLVLPVPVVSAAAAIRGLGRVKFTSARDAIEELATWQDSSRILQLYRLYFPRQFAHSVASTEIPRQENDGMRGYSERELEFFGLVDRELFPLPEMQFESERMLIIPIYPCGVDWEDDRENVRLSLRAAMALLSDDDMMLWEAWLPPQLRPLLGERNWECFAERCRNTKGLAMRLPLLLNLVGLDTGNLWLDTSWESSWEEFPWEEEAIEYLKKEWRKAQHIYARLNPLLDRMDKHPRYWLTQLVKLWNSAVRG